MRWAAVAGLALLGAACSQTEEPIVIDASPRPPDGAPRPDSGPRPDAAPLFDAAPPDAADPPPRYTTDRVHSPITPSVARVIEAISLRGPTFADNVFSKVGDSITVADQFMKCFAGATVDLGAHGELAGTLDHFKLGMVGGTTPYQRVSLAAKVGASADYAVTGDPAPVDQEVAAAMPRYAVVMFGSNDVASRTVFTFGAAMLEIVDRLSAQGVVPLLSTAPPNDQTPGADVTIPRFNAVVRGIAQARQVPLMDYWKLMAALPEHGLGSDNLHPNVFSGGACVLTAEGLTYGYNTRNLVTLEALDRARSIVEGDPPPDPPATVPTVNGAGSYDAPFVIGGLPFTDLRDTSASPSSRIASYPGCNAAQNESGPEYVYKITVDATVTVRAMVIVRSGVDVDVHLMKGLSGGADCVQRNDKEVVAQLMPGTYYFILDTFVPADGVPRSGEYLFVVVLEG